LNASIIIPTYNKLRYLRATIRSLEAVDYPVDAFEVVVVNDGSDDGTGRFLEQVEVGFSLRHIHHRSNRGRAAARNTGIEGAVGRVLIFLDDDMEVTARFLQAHTGLHASGEKRVVLGNIRRSAETRPTALVRYLDTRGVHKLKPGQQIPFRYFTTGNASVDRDLLFQAGLFDERFRHWGGEDLELGCRLARAGGEFHFARDALCYQSDYKDIASLCAAMRSYGEHSLPIIVEKHPHLETLLHTDVVAASAGSVRPFARKLRILFLRFALWKPWVRLIRSLAGLLNRFFVPPIVFDYLILSHSLRGYQKGHRRVPEPVPSKNPR
jgi:glycosyltransferase involved in cell wall biosynthesis